MLDLKGNKITYFGHSTFSLTTPSGHVALIDRLVGFYQKRQSRILELLGDGPLTAAQLVPGVFPRAKPKQLFLTLSEVVGNLEVLEDQGRVRRAEREGRIFFEAA